MRRLPLYALLLTLVPCGAIFLLGASGFSSPPTVPPQPSPAYLGFDLNEYPGDAALPVLRKTFAFLSFWIGPPPGQSQSTWLGKRALLQSEGFGFVVLSSGPESRTLKHPAGAALKGSLDAGRAAKSAASEGFATGTILFLDIEEGGRLPAVYHQYLASWADGIRKAGFRAGVYCSAIPVSEGKGESITTAKDIQDHAGSGEIVFWVYNDRCPPSPGCVFPASAPLPRESGFTVASVWQYAQSPRRREFTAGCPASYAADGNCYAPGDAAHKWFLDANVAASADPSSAR